MATSYIICTRAVKKDRLIAEPGKTLYLEVPDGALPKPEHATDQAAWLKKVLKSASWGAKSLGYVRGDLLIFIHGYNNSTENVIARHRQLKADLTAVGFKGEIISFDWPSASSALNYQEDRHDAKKTAFQLVSDGISLLSAQQQPDCYINIHILAHSTGAYVVREAFDDADDSQLQNSAWRVSQVVFIGGDISSGSLQTGDSSSESLYRHCTRLTNYSNLYDSVLKLSNFKRVGIAPRCGRVGLPENRPSKAVNIDCSDYFFQLDNNPDIKQRDQVNDQLGTFCHSWHIGNLHFARDLFDTLKGDLDRSVFATRTEDLNQQLQLS